MKRSRNHDAIISLAILFSLTGCALERPPTPPGPQGLPDGAEDDVPVAGSSAIGPSTTAHVASDPTDLMTPNVTYETDAEAFETDVRLMASDLGIDVEKVREHVRFAEGFQRFSGDLVKRMPDKIAAIWIDPVPALAGHVVFVGDVPEDVEVQENVELRGGAVAPLHAQMAAAERVADSLLKLGYREFKTYYHMQTQKIHAEVVAPTSGAGMPASTQLVEAVAQRRQRNAQAPEARLMSAGDLVVIPIESAQMTQLHSRGGAHMFNPNNGGECTSGWAVREASTGRTGVITANHCSFMSKYIEPESAGAVYDVDRIRGAGNRDGDLAWYTTTHSEFGSFYSSGTTIRSVDSWVGTASMVGLTICQFGRGSRNRRCHYQIINVGLTIAWGANQEIVYGKQVEVTDPNTSDNTPSFGDSGGGWSFSNTAYGLMTISFFGGSRSYFTPVEQISTLGLSLL